jgi:hypothetical protein
MARACRDDLPDRQSGKFFNQDWTGKIGLKGFDKFDFWRMRRRMSFVGTSVFRGPDVYRKRLTPPPTSRVGCHRDGNYIAQR